MIPSKLCEHLFISTYTKYQNYHRSSIFLWGSWTVFEIYISRCTHQNAEKIRRINCLVNFAVKKSITPSISSHNPELFSYSAISHLNYSSAAKTPPGFFILGEFHLHYEDAIFSNPLTHTFRSQHLDNNSYLDRIVSFRTHGGLLKTMQNCSHCLNYYWYHPSFISNQKHILDSSVANAKMIFFQAM